MNQHNANCMDDCCNPPETFAGQQLCQANCCNPLVPGTAPARPLTYLASPYSHPSPQVREHRFKEVTHAASWLIKNKKWNVFAPITHSHPLAVHGGLEGDWETWKRIDEEYLSVSSRMIVLELAGWQQSTGVKAETEIALRLGVPVYYMRPDPEVSNHYQVQSIPHSPFSQTPSFEPPIWLVEPPTQRAQVSSLTDSPPPYDADALAKEGLGCASNLVTPDRERRALIKEKFIAAMQQEDTTNPKDLIGLTKPPLRLVPPVALLHIAKVMGLGAKKYGPYNWRAKKVRYTVYLEAALRHIYSALDGEEIDPESGQPHTAHAAACMAILLDAKSLDALVDDRAQPGKTAETIKQMTESK